jgi:hypothetical protein
MSRYGVRRGMRLIAIIVSATRNPSLPSEKAHAPTQHSRVSSVLRIGNKPTT